MELFSFAVQNDTAFLSFLTQAEKTKTRHSQNSTPTFNSIYCKTMQKIKSICHLNVLLKI